MPSLLRRHAAACLALLLGLVTTLVAALYVHHGARERRQRRFDDAVREGTLSLQQRLDTYQAMLLGTRGLFISSAQVSRREFRGYVQSLELRRRYPGIQGIGFTLWLPRDVLAAHEESLRAQGYDEYRVWPEGERDVYTSILFLEPLDARNERAFGFDMFSEPIRREAMERALRTGLPAASGKVRLVQEREDEPPQQGFLIYLPVFRAGDTSTPEARRAALRGFVYAPFRVGDLLQGLRFPGALRTLDLHIHDGAEPTEESLLYASAPAHPPPAPGLRRTVAMEVAGRPWTLVFTAREAFLADSARTQLQYVVAGGLTLSLLLFLITRAQANAREAAEVASREQQRLAQEAQAAVRIRDEFLGIAAHELRTPLTSLTLQLQLLRRLLHRAPPPEPAQLERGVLTSERQTARLSQLVDSLLDISRLTSGRMELQLEELDLCELTHEVARRFETQAQAVGVALTVDAPGAVRGRWDRMRVEQVLTNLLSNALKYGRGAPVDVRVRAEEAGARLEVQDRGIGIAPEDAPRIFERFERAVSSRHYGGLGLGLFITRQLVQALGGHISVASAPGQGSTFTVRLPARTPEQASPPA